MKILFIIKYKILGAVRRLLSFRKEPFLKKALISTFLFSYLYGGLELLLKFFYFINSFTPVGSILLERLFFVYFFFLFIMLIVSSLILGYSSFFKSKETDFLLSLPLSNRDIWFYNYAKVSLMSSWAFIFLSIPVIAAFGLVKDAAMSFYLLTVAGFFPFIIITSILGNIILFAFLAIVPKKYMKYVLTVILTSMIYILWTTIPKGTYYESTNVMFIINTLLRHTDITLNNFLPSAWLARELLESLDGNFKNYLFFLMLSLSQGLFLIANMYLISEYLYHRIYVNEQSHKAKKFYFISKARPFYNKYLRKLIPSKYMAIIFKDFVVFFRDPLQWSQFFVFFGLIFLYIINLRNMRYDLDDPFWKNLITFFNLGAVCLTMATLNTRFIFPLISIEGKRIWILGMVPGERKKLVYAKYFYSAIISFIVVIPLIILSNSVIKSGFGIYVLSLATGLAASMTLSAFSVGLGALYPNFKSESPSEIVSGFGATFVLVLSIMYIIYVVGIEGYIGHLIFVAGISGVWKYILFVFGAVIITSSSVAVGYFSLRKGAQHFEDIDF